MVTANVGHLGEITGVDCPSTPYQGALCSVAQEAVIALNLAALEADVLLLEEVLDADWCTEDTWEGDPDLPCTGAPEREPYQQAHRIVGEGYTITCNGVAHYDCIAVNSERIAVDQCPPGEICQGASRTPDVPAECAENGGITSVSAVDATIDGVGLTIVSGHPLNAVHPDDDPCRLAQYRSIFEDLAASGPALVGGDMNLDPYRFPDVFPSAEYWHEQVGPRFVVHNVPAEGPPTPTLLGLATIDFVLSDFLVGDGSAEGEAGSCLVLGESEGSERIDGELAQMDHRAVWCPLRLPSQW